MQPTFLRLQSVSLSKQAIGSFLRWCQVSRVIECSFPNTIVANWKPAWKSCNWKPAWRKVEIENLPEKKLKLKPSLEKSWEWKPTWKSCVANITLRRGGIWNLAQTQQKNVKIFSEFWKFSVVFEQNSKSHLSAAWCLPYKEGKIWPIITCFVQLCLFCCELLEMLVCL